MPVCAVQGDHGLHTPEGAVPIRTIMEHHDLPTREGGVLWCAVMRPDLPTRKGGVLGLTSVKQLRNTTLRDGVWGYATTLWLCNAPQQGGVQSRAGTASRRERARSSRAEIAGIWEQQREHTTTSGNAGSRGTEGWGGNGDILGIRHGSVKTVRTRVWPREGARGCTGDYGGANRIRKRHSHIAKVRLSGKKPAPPQQTNVPFMTPRA